MNAEYVLAWGLYMNAAVQILTMVLVIVKEIYMDVLVSVIVQY